MPSNMNWNNSGDAILHNKPVPVNEVDGLRAMDVGTPDF